MSIFDQIKTAVLRALGRFARNKAEHQAQGMTQEARGIVAGTQDFARSNPLGFGILAVLGVATLWLAVRRKSVTSQT
jgi:hypothetical protein